MADRGSPEWRQAISRGLKGRHSTRGNPKLTAAQHERVAALFQAGESVQAVMDRFSISRRHAYLLRSRAITVTLA